VHELSVAVRIAEIAHKEAEERGISNLRGVIVQVGCLTCVSPEALELAFEFARRDTLAANARLTIERVQAVGVCRRCGADVEADSVFYACPECGSRDIEFNTGEELQVVGLEFDDPTEVEAEATNAA